MHAEGVVGETYYLEMDSIVTTGFPFVQLNFNHIGKVFSQNRCRVEVSANNGNWVVADSATYLGESRGFQQLDYFNEGSYAAAQFNNLWQTGQWTGPNSIPQQTWWRREVFDLSTLAGSQAKVKIRFALDILQQIPGPLGGGQTAGWFIDDVMIVRSTCELDPPVVDFNIGSAVCYPNKPENGIVRTPTDDYRIGLLATDVASGIDTVLLSYKIGVNGPTIQSGMHLINAPTGEHEDTITGAVVGDTVFWFVEAFDNSCPNVTRVPDIFGGTFGNGDYVFYIDSGLPVKCGQGDCGQFAQTINQFPYIEGFELSGNFITGTGNGDVGTAHRGTWPLFPTGNWEVAPTITSAGYSWGITTGPTGTQFTGPNGDNTTGGGQYVYVESSQNNSPGNTSPARFTTACIDLTQISDTMAVEFYYHAYGDDIDRLLVDVDTGSDQVSFRNGYFRITGGEQQTRSTDPWKRAIFSINEFNGTFIRLRFRVPYGGGDKGDWGVDDLKIFEPDPYDVEILSYNDPVDGLCSYSSTESVGVTVRNVGRRTLTKIPIAIRVDGNPPLWDTITTNLALGDTMSYNINPAVAPADLSALGPHNIEVFTRLNGDSDTTNNRVNSPLIEHFGAITSFPYIESFEDGLVGQQNHNVNSTGTWRFDDGLDPSFRWQVGEELTSTRSTGPRDGFYFGGKYLYTEADGSSNQVETYFRSVCFDLTGMTAPTMDFFYHMYGANISRLELQVSLESEDNQTWNTIPNSAIFGGSNQSNELGDWKLHRVSLATWAGQKIKLRFAAIRSTTPGVAADIAIDQMMVYDKIASDLGVTSINFPGRGVPTINTNQPQVTVQNYGTSPASSYTVHFDITMLCGPNQGTTTQFSQSFNQNIAVNGSAQLTLSNAGIVWPSGEFRVDAYTSITGDNNTFTDSIGRNITGFDTVDIDWGDNFDNCNFSESGFLSQQGLFQWELGTPVFGNISTANSQPNAWVTNLDGPFYTGFTENLSSPFLDNFDTIVFAEVQMRHNLDLGSSADDAAAMVLFSGAGGFRVLGANFVSAGLGSNWPPFQNGLISSTLFGGDPAFIGSTNGNWIFSSYPLAEFNRNQNVARIRFSLRSTTNASTSLGGWGIDDFRMYVPPQNSATSVALTTVNPIPYPNQEQQFLITYNNTGAKTLDTLRVRVYIDGNPLPISDVFGDNDTIIPPPNKLIPTLGSSSPANHTDTLRMKWPGNLVTSGVHDVCVVTFRPNHKFDNLPADDSICYQVIVPDEFDFTAAGTDSSYCNDFEGTSGLTPWVSTNAFNYSLGLSSWEQGDLTTSASGFDTAYNGTNAWVTNLSGDYKNRDSSMLYSPIFLVDASTNYEVNFWHWIKTEKFHDGGNVEVTSDGGKNWYPVGFYVHNRADWFNTAFVTSLDIIKPGWTDTTGGWVNAKHVFVKDTLDPAAGPTAQLVFRMRFGSDQDIKDAGWAIDQFCFYKTTEDAQSAIGQDEFVLPDEVVIGELAPNPANDHSELSLYLPQNKDVGITIVNSIGQLMHEETVQKENGVQHLRFDTNNWRSGVYLMNIEVDGTLHTRRLVISK